LRAHVVLGATPVLVGLLSYAAVTGDPIWGGLLLFTYGLGLGVPPGGVDRIGLASCQQTFGFVKAGRKLTFKR